MPLKPKPYYGSTQIRDEKTNVPATYMLEPAYEEERTEADGAASVTFSEPVTHLVIYNRDATNDGVFTVNGLAKIVPAGADTPVTRFGGAPSPTVTITGSTSFIISRFD